MRVDGQAAIGKLVGVGRGVICFQACRVWRARRAAPRRAARRLLMSGLRIGAAIATPYGYGCLGIAVFTDGCTSDLTNCFYVWTLVSVF